MSKVAQIQIDRHDSYKYQCTAVTGSETFARVYYKDDGSLDEKLTYNKHYYAELHPEEAPKKEEIKKGKEETSSHKKSFSKSHSREKGNDQHIKFIDGKFGKFIFTIIPILPIWWVIKCPFSWISYPVRKSVKLANEQGNKLWPTYRFKEGDGCFTKFLGTIFLILPFWWIIKLIGNLLTILPRLILNNWTIKNDNFWPRYSFTKF